MEESTYIDGQQAKQLISLVENRPCLWDKSLTMKASFKEREMTKKAWAEVFVEIKSDFEEMEENERKKLGNEIMKRWRNIRDSYFKFVKKEMRVTKSGAGASNMKKYIYYDRLRFLNKNLDEEELPDSLSANDENPQKEIDNYAEYSQILSLIGDRPVLWDTTLGIYKDKDKKKKAWTEICVKVNKNFEELGEKDKDHFCNELIRKWVNTRDHYFRVLRKQKKAGAGILKQYKYQDQLKFLNKVFPTCTDEENPQDEMWSDLNIDIDDKLLISLVEVKPWLWDKTLEIYNDINATKKAWREICVEIYTYFEELKYDEKNKFGREILRTWINIRDSYVKSRRKQKFASASSETKYIYHDQLQFLNKVIGEQQMAESLSVGEENLHLLILLVRARPVLWDKTLIEYQNRNATKKAWMEICVAINSDFEKLGDKEKSTFGKELLEKWSNIRDAYMRSTRRKQKDGKNLKKYLYHNQLQFLNALIGEQEMACGILEVIEKPQEESGEEMCEQTSEHGIDEEVIGTPLMELRPRRGKLNDVEPSMPQGGSDVDPYEDESYHVPVATRKPKKKRESRKRKVDDVEPIIMQALENSPLNRHLSFFNAVIPSLHDFEEDEVVEFQLGVLQLMSDIEQQKRMHSAVSSTNCTSLSIEHDPEVDQDVKPIIRLPLL